MTTATRPALCQRCADANARELDVLADMHGHTIGAIAERYRFSNVPHDESTARALGRLLGAIRVVTQRGLVAECEHESEVERLGGAK